MDLPQEEKPLNRYWPHKKLKLMMSGFFLILLPFLIIVAVLGPKVVDTTTGTNTKSFAAEGDPAQIGQWSEVKEFPVKATHTSLLPTGKVIFWPSFKGGGDMPNLWDPASDVTVSAPKAGYNIFCSGHTLMADGKLFVAGGHIVTPDGLPHATIYDTKSNTWNRVPDMNKGRWYPTTTVMANGDILTLSGTDENGKWNDMPQVFDVSENKWRNLTTAIQKISYYPFVYQIAANKVFVAGNQKTSRFLDTSGTGKWLNSIYSNFGIRSAGTSVMYANGKVAIFGGGDPSTNTVETIDINAANPKWVYAAPMPSKKRHATATLLPTGDVLVTGGTTGNDDEAELANYAADLWNPATNTWKRLASNTVYRGYHSTALLLPDGRVLSAGGEKSGTSYEIFSPPYLFKGARPSITSAPTQVGYGKVFSVGTPDAANINKVRLIRLGSVTHSFNQSQRILALNFVKKTNSLDVTAPENGIILPPGYYMLFIINSNGVPSVAKIIKIGAINSPLPNPPLPTLTPIPPAQEQANFDADMRILNTEGHAH